MDPTDRFVEAVRNPTPDIHLDVMTALIGASFEREGDVEEYERCKAIFLDSLDAMGVDAPPDHRPNYARDRGRGAPGA